MGITRYTDGNVTVTLDGGLESLVRKALDAAGGETLRLMEQAAQDVADKARAEWYAQGTGVKQQTGKSGDIQVVSTVSDTEVRVSVGSTDTRIAGKAGKPLVAVLRRRGRLSLEEKLVGREEYFAWKSARKPVGRAGKSGSSNDWVIYVASDYASDGRNMITELVRKPMSVKVKALTPEMTKAIAAKVRGG